MPSPSSLVNLLILQAQILKEGAGLLQGSRSSVVRASTAKVGDLGLDSQWLPMHGCFYPDLPPVAYHQLLPQVVVNQYSYKNNHVCPIFIVMVHIIVLYSREKLMAIGLVTKSVKMHIVITLADSQHLV